MIKKKNKISAGKIAAIGVGVAAAGAGAYYLLGPKGKQHQKQAKAWMEKMKLEVEKNLKKIKDITKPLYHNTVDSIAAIYNKKYKEHEKEINAFAKKLKGEWKNAQNKARPIIKKAI